MKKEQKGKQMKKSFFCFVVFLLLMWAAGPAFAHMLWLNPMDYTPAVSSTTEIGIGWGHSFPVNRVDQEVKEDRMEAIQAVDPDGKTVPLVKVAADRYQLKVEKAGAYIVTARIKPGFFTMTPEGRKWGNKKEIENGVKCTNFHIEAKAVILAGGDPKGFDRAAGQTVELVPADDPQQLKAGQKFAVRVFYQGKPLADAAVNGIYAGFEEPKQAEHGHGKNGHGIKHYPVETQTDAQGRLSFVPDRAGYWLLIVSHKPAYAEKEICDEYMYNVTYAMEVK
jgi:uncharacterized GH25 family protein